MRETENYACFTLLTMFQLCLISGALAMQTLKKDLFAPIVVPIKKRNKGKKLTRPIPQTLDWKDKHGSWAVLHGIVKVEPDR
jgi:hypothetical protein